MTELRELNRQLAALLADQNPGIASWRAAMRRVLLGMAVFSGVDSVVFAAQVEIEKLPPESPNLGSTAH